MKLNWGQSIFLFLLLFLTLLAIFVVFALRQNNDLVTNDYYEKGADYTHQMEINSRSAMYADSIHILNENHYLLTRFSKSMRQLVDTVEIYFYRPSDKKLDFKYTLKLNSDSVIVKKDHLVSGRYKVKFLWIYSQKSYQVEKDFYIE